ncbi:PAS domain-containing protein [Angustibacter aerolatus]
MRHPSADALGVLVQYLPVALAGFDRDLRCTCANPRWLDLVGAAREQDVIGAPVDELLPALGRQHLRSLTAVAAGRHEGFERQVDLPGGELWQLTAFPLAFAGRATGVGLVAEDRSDAASAQVLDLPPAVLPARTSRQPLLLVP